ncbi:MAG: pyridoxal kinase [Rhodospirillaceae bacterium]
MAILSIQSHVTYGHVGNAAAVFALQRLGREVWPIHTVNFATHTGHGRPTGTVTPPEIIRDTVRRLDGLGILGRCAAVLTGYIGSAEAGDAILEAVRTVRGRNAAALWCCDPVMGDRDRGVFVADTVAAFFERHAEEADILTPNAFELERLTNRPVRNPSDIAVACRALIDRGVGEVVATSLPGLRDGEIASAAVTRTGAWLASAPELALAGRPDGAGDLFAAIYLGKRLDRNGGPGDALAHAVAALHGVLAATSEELDIVGAQEELIAPRLAITAERLG